MFFEEKLFRVTAKVKYDIVIRRKVSYSQYRILCAGLMIIVFVIAIFRKHNILFSKFN